MATEQISAHLINVRRKLDEIVFYFQYDDGFSGDIAYKVESLQEEIDILDLINPWRLWKICFTIEGNEIVKTELWPKEENGTTILLFSKRSAA